MNGCSNTPTFLLLQNPLLRHTTQKIVKNVKAIVNRRQCRCVQKIIRLNIKDTVQTFTIPYPHIDLEVLKRFLSPFYTVMNLNRDVLSKNSHKFPIIISSRNIFSFAVNFFIAIVLP